MAEDATDRCACVELLAHEDIRDDLERLSDSNRENHPFVA